MESPPATSHDDRTAKTISGNEATDSRHSDESPILSSCHQRLVSSKRTSFLDLPGELRNQIYRPVLRHDGIRNLKLKYKFNSDGSIHIHEGFPPLYHALPQLREEILSIYYSESRFRVHLWTEEHRAIFRDWVEHRGRVLNGLKHLELIFRQLRRHHEIGLYSLSAALLVTINAEGQLCMPRITPMFKFCPCWVIPLVETAYKQCITENQTAHPNPTRHGPKTTNEASAPNPIIIFALKLCSLRDLPQRHQPNWSSLLHKLNEDKHKGLVPCWRYWEHVWTVLGLLESSGTMRPRSP